MRLRHLVVKWMILGVAALFALAAASHGGSAAPGIDWRSLPYFDYPHQNLILPTDGSWKPAVAVNAGYLNPQPVNAAKPLPWSFIWTANCTDGEQFVSFSKEFMAPGVPLDGPLPPAYQLELDYGPGNQLYGDRPYKSAVFLINGTEAAKLGNISADPRTVAPQFRGNLPASALNAVRYGANTATIRVEKAAQKKGEPCNNPRSGRYVGVLALLNLQFGSNLQVLPSTHPLTIQKNVKNGATVAMKGTVRFLNAGPSASLEGMARITISGPGKSFFNTGGGMNTWSAPLDCKISENEAACSFKDFPAGATASFGYNYAGTKVNAGFFKNGAGEIQVIATIGGIGPDPKPGKSTQMAVTVLCAEGATDPRCK